MERLSVASTANVNLYHVTKFPLCLPFAVHYNYTKSVDSRQFYPQELF